MSVKSVSRRALFDVPIPYESKESRKTEVLVVDSDSSGAFVTHFVCIEDELEKQVALDFDEVTLSNLVDKGVDPHSLDMIDSSKLGIDSGVDELANHILSHSSDYVESSKSE